MYTDNKTITIGNIINASQSDVDRVNVANKPTRADCATDKISHITGATTKNPIAAA